MSTDDPGRRGILSLGPDVAAPRFRTRFYMASGMEKRQQGAIDEAVGHLRQGGVVAFPTDTLFGLGADVFSLQALAKVFSIKGRPEQMPLPVLVSGWEQVQMVARPESPLPRRLVRRYWPGPLTLVLNRQPGLPDLITAGGDTVAVRMPFHPVPIALAEGLGSPITGTSANRSGGEDIRDLETLETELGHKVDYLVTWGPLPAGVASTVVDLTSDEPRLLRPGALDFEDVLAACR